MRIPCLTTSIWRQTDEMFYGILSRLSLEQLRASRPSWEPRARPVREKFGVGTLSR